jgi:hypothetical protein
MNDFIFTVGKGVNKIRRKILHHWQFIEYCEMLAEEYSSVIRHAKLLWFFRGKVLCCFWLSEDTVLHFLEEKTEIS